MQEGLIERMRKVEFGLDFTTHVERVCKCPCSICVDRGHHSIGNCEYSCHEMYVYNERLYRDDPEVFYECECDCKFCSSGKVVTRHAKIDCDLHCYKSEFNISRI
jgi:hypothetical protein